MDINGEQRIPAPQQTVWDALNDPEVLKACITGCESVEKVADNQFTARVTMAVGPVKAKFTGDVTLSDIDPPNGYTITGKGSGGAAGFGKGSAQVALTPDGDGTLLRYTAQASVGGKLAQIGQRLVDSAARKMADEFFTSFNALLTARGATTANAAGAATASEAAASTAEPIGAAEPAPSAPPGPASVSETQKKPQTNIVLWLGIAAVAIGLVVWYVTR